jgi:hypothetical protein
MALVQIFFNPRLPMCDFSPILRGLTTHPAAIGHRFTGGSAGV